MLYPASSPGASSKIHRFEGAVACGNPGCCGVLGTWLRLKVSVITVDCTRVISQLWSDATDVCAEALPHRWQLKDGTISWILMWPQRNLLTRSRHA